MDTIIPVFQYEIRYSHMLNFSQISKKILSPYVKLAQSIKVENQNTINERIILNFEEEDYLIIISWDRILIKGQGNLNTFTGNNSPLVMPFFSIFEKIKKLDDFGAVQNALLAINHIKKYDIEEDKILSLFLEKSISKPTSEVLNNITDIAITLESKISGDETFVSYGPYFGKDELKRRPLIPVNLDNLEHTDILGVLLEYKQFTQTKTVNFNEFKKMINDSNKIISKIWKTL